MDTVSEFNEDNFKKQQEMIEKKLKELGKKSNSVVIKKMNSESDISDNTEIQARMSLVRRITNESLEMVREGDMSFDEAIKDIISNIKLI